MRFRVQQRFTAALAAVEAALLDPAFLGPLAELPELGAPALLDTTVAGRTVRQRVRYRFASNLSPAVTAVVDPARLTWVEETTYDLEAHRGEHRIVPDHYAGRLASSYVSRLETCGDGAVSTVRTIEGGRPSAVPDRRRQGRASHRRRGQRACRAREGRPDAVVGRTRLTPPPGGATTGRCGHSSGRPKAGGPIRTPATKWPTHRPRWTTTSFRWSRRHSICSTGSTRWSGR